MDLIGIHIRKQFEGFGTFNGIVDSFDSQTGFFKILYEDGDSEDLEFKELESILKQMSENSQNLYQTARKSARGRPPKKRQKLEEDSSLKPCVFDLVKPELPPSSSDLDLEGVNVLDLFSVYTCLRSFSRSLFLSPFRLESFVAALRSEKANFLIDSVHFSLLQALKGHLEVLGSDGSRSASNCLRNLNWELLDMITWPVFLVHYLVTHASVMKPEIKLSRLKLLDPEYYKQPVGIKLEILGYLCDDVIEVSSIRSELDKRTMGYEFYEDADLLQTSNRKRRRKSSTIIDTEGVEEVPEENEDGNLDECCLCSMDGSLICCDGCPAAFHSKCVGVAKNLLPEGDWYCPECVVKKSEGLMKLPKLSCGAELLGVDPHGRLYFGSCDRLLVSNSCESDASYHYYNKLDSYAVISILKSCYMYGEIVNAISMYWGFPVDAYASSNNYQNGIRYIMGGLDNQMQSTPMLLSEDNVVSDGNAEKSAIENSASSAQNGQEISQASNSVTEPIAEDIRTADLVQTMQSPQQVSDNCPIDSVSPSNQVNQVLVQEGVAENVHIADMAKSPQQVSNNCPIELVSLSNQINQILVSEPVAEHISNMVQSPQLVSNDCLMDFVSPSNQITPKQADLDDKIKAETMDMQCNPSNYSNYYIFGRIASSISVELTLKLLEGNNDASKKFVVDIKSLQLQAINNNSSKGLCYAYQQLSIDVQKENCGWCFSCRASGDIDCLFKVAGGKNLKEFKDETLDSSKFQTAGISHLDSAMRHILSIENRARSLLSGPWAKPHYSQRWCQNVMNASDVSILKHLLLTLELNLRRVALSAEWSKAVDDTHAIVSSSTVISPVRASYGNSKKRGRKSITGGEIKLVSDNAKLSDIYWWRGGRLSRQVFQCKTLPRALASKCGRQAGFKKIPHIIYPDSSEFAKRSKYVSWRIAVEMSHSVAQLIYRAKDFDSNIKWDEFLNKGPIPKLGKESKKMAKLLKNVNICGKCKEGSQMKYLLDFGKRETLPAFVTKHGVLFEESTADRKRYWLTEAHVPLSLLKAYEEKNIKKKIARLLKRAGSETKTAKESETKTKKRKNTEFGTLNMNESECNTKKRKRSDGLSFLFSKLQKSEKVICGHCNIDVLVREAVNCQVCDGLFHRKHFRVPKGATTTTYICPKCKNTKSMIEEEKDIKSVKAKVKDTKSTKVKVKDAKIMEAKGKEKKIAKAKDKEIKSVNLTEMNLRSVNRKAKGVQIMKEEEYGLKKWNLRGRNKKIMDLEAIGIGNEKDVQKQVRPLRLKIKFQGKSIVPSTSKFSENKMSQVVTEKRKLVLKISKKKSGLKKSKKGKSKGKKSKKSSNEKTWHKGKRSNTNHSYWLNGLFWARKPVAEHQSLFRERNIILPLQNTEEPVNPFCCLCHKEYNPGVIYISCERCHDWFHGDAFSLTAENANYLIGFRCHKCRNRSEPVCPFLNIALNGDADLDIAVSNCQHGQDNHCHKSTVCKEDSLVGQRSKACIEPQNGVDKDHDNLYETLLINGHMINLEKLHGEPKEDCLNIVKSENHIDKERKEDALLLEGEHVASIK